MFGFNFNTQFAQCATFLINGGCHNLGSGSVLTDNGQPEAIVLIDEQFHHLIMQMD